MLQLNVLAAVAQFKREIMTKRVNAGIAAASRVSPDEPWTAAPTTRCRRALAAPAPRLKRERMISTLTMEAKASA